MHSVQRRFGKTRGVDEAQVALLLKDFQEADKMLEKLIEAARNWRDSWKDILSYQQKLVREYQSIYNPIKGAGTEHEATHVPVETPRDMLQRVVNLNSQYSELKEDLMHEINQVDERIIVPATDVRSYIHPLNKQIKRRQDCKVAYEKYQDRYDSASKKHGRNEKENAALINYTAELNRAREDYEVADERLRSKLSPVVNTVFSLLPHLLNAQIMIQHNLLAHCYTQVHTYCQEEGFQSPPPAMVDIISSWNDQYGPIQMEIESFACISKGKTARLPTKQSSLQVENSYGRRRISNGGSVSTRTSVSPARSDTSFVSRTSVSPSPNSETRPPVNLESRPRILSVPSQGSLALSTPNYSSHSTSPNADSANKSAHAPAGPRADYFSRDRAVSADLAAAAAQKKKPPPPPVKRTPSFQAIWVTALYDFAGQGQGDLNFREGDRIKVVKKTESMQDWWTGELNGVLGEFPANYCQ